MPDLTFGQSIGVTPMPSQLAPREISTELSAHLFAAFYYDMNLQKENHGWEDHLRSDWRVIMNTWFIFKMHLPADEVSTTVEDNIRYVKSLLYSQDYVKVFDFAQFVCRSEKCPPSIRSNVGKALVDCRSAYRLIDKTIIPITSEADATSVQEAFKVAELNPAQGPRTHMKAAAEALTEGDWAGSVRESISAVESAAIVVEPAADTLGKALATLERKRRLHGGLKQAFGALYGYTSDADGVRHALVLENKADVNEADAMFMFGACTAFVSYLLNIAKS